MARRIHRWTKYDDRKLLRHLGYVRQTAGAVLSGSLSTADRHSAVLRVWPDADLAGDPAEDTKSTGGEWVEIASVITERAMALGWSSAKQTFTADCTTAAEMGQLHKSMKDSAIPLGILLEFLLGRPIVVEMMEDNSSTIVAAKAG